MGFGSSPKDLHRVPGTWQLLRAPTTLGTFGHCWHHWDHVPDPATPGAVCKGSAPASWAGFAGLFLHPGKALHKGENLF